MLAHCGPGWLGTILLLMRVQIGPVDCSSRASWKLCGGLASSTSAATKRRKWPRLLSSRPNSRTRAAFGGHVLEDETGLRVSPSL